MTTNSPNPVDGDVQALIDHINTQLDLLRSVTIKHVDEFQIEDIKMDIKVHEIALASLTAEPVGYGNQRKDGTGFGSSLRSKHLARAEDLVYKPVPLYTTPPAQLLRPVELPGFVYDAEGEPWIHGDEVVDLLRSLGHEVKND
ncbi:hypothetical protein KFO32_16660 [Pantoea ananatis]|uniref:hypothetical protein n=1 Tax=Pantoea ananas TaxID=553 RepID=UPI001FF5749D|nr:hypothetical protein [Pantoea ananatis]MCK0554674.1 hypothetical protein [Pantoea ananatis]